MGIVKSAPIANIFACEVITNEAERRMFFFTGAKSVTAEPVISEGKEEELRARNTILAQNILEDILKGYNIKLKDVVFSPELMELVQGGGADVQGGAYPEYNAPSIGGEVSRVRFILRLYSEVKDCDGSTECVYRFTFPGCFGSKASFSLEDGEFTSPEYVVKSRAKRGQSQMVIDLLERPPVYISSADEYPSQPKEGTEYIALEKMNVGSFELSAGDCLLYDGTDTVKLSPME